MDALYRDHAGNALRLAFLLTGERARAEDLVHDGFVRVMGRVRAIRDPERFGSYLRRTIVNLAKNEQRHAAVHRRSLSAIVAEHPGRTATMPDVEGRDELHLRLLELPYRQRAALVLRYCEDMPETEVAGVLGTSPKAIRSLVGRGLAALRATNGTTEGVSV